MLANTRRRFFTTAAFIAAVGVIGWAGVVAAREAAVSPGRAAPYLNADILSSAVSAATLSAFLASEDVSRHFRERGNPRTPSRGQGEYHATLALPEDQLTI